MITRIITLHAPEAYVLLQIIAKFPDSLPSCDRSDFRNLWTQFPELEVA